jgi:hypothetical protein
LLRQGELFGVIGFSRTVENLVGRLEW